MQKNLQSRGEAKRLGLTRYWTGLACSRGHIAERITANGCCSQCFLEDRRAQRAKRPGYQTREELDAKRDAKTRKCTGCNKTFPATTESFVLLKNGEWSGLSAECRECRNKRFPAYYKKNRKKLIARAIKFAKKRRQRPEVREKERISSRERKRVQLADPVEREQHNKRGRDWRKNNPERAKLFKHMQPGYRRMRAMKRYAAELSACPPWADMKKIETIYLLADRLTRETGIKYEVDHIYPLIHPRSCGLHVPWNLQVITKTANQMKGNRLPVRT